MKVLKKISLFLISALTMSCNANIKKDCKLKEYSPEKYFKPKYNLAIKNINKKNYSKAVNILKNLEKKCYVPAIYTLYELYDKGSGVKPDKIKALDYLKKASKYNYPVAKYELALKMLKGKEINQNTDEAIKILKNLAEKSSPETGENNIFYKLQAKANVMLAKIYFEGKYLKQDLNQANEYGYVIGSLPPTQEYNIGRNLLGEAYLLYGKIIEARKDKGIKTDWYSFVAFDHAIEMGNLNGYYEKGLVYLKEKNIQFAADTFGIGCYQGHAESCYKAGLLYEEGKVYKKGDKNEWGEIQEDPLIVAKRYFEKCAKLGNLKCKEKLNF